MTTSTITDLLLFLGNENGHILVERGYVLKPQPTACEPRPANQPPGELAQSYMGLPVTRPCSINFYDPNMSRGTLTGRGRPIA